MTASLLPNGKQTFFDTNGNPLVNGSVSFFIPGTSTPKTTWQDAGQTISNQNPITLDNLGSAVIYGSGQYREIVKDALGNLIWDQLTQDFQSIVAAEFSTLAGSTGSSLIGFETPYTGAVLRTAQSKMAEQISPFDFGAVGDGVTDDTLAIQRALAALIFIGGGTLWLDRTFVVSPQPSGGLANTFGANSVCIDISGCSNVRIDGTGGLKLKAGSTGTSGAMLGNLTGAAITNFSTGQITLDGNKANTTGNISGCVVVNGISCAIDDLIVMNTTYLGIQFAVGSTGCRSMGATVTGTSNIGIQAQFASQLIIALATIKTTGDNAIDVSANNGTQFQIQIFGNNITICKNGIFLESGQTCIVVHNNIDGMSVGSAGIILNQIQTTSGRHIVCHNHITNSTGASDLVGVLVNNNSGASIFSENYFENLKYSFYCSGVAQYLRIGNNYHRSIGLALIGVPATVSSLVFSDVAEQTVYDAPGPYPFTASPLTNANNVPGRFTGRCVPLYSLARQSALGSLAAEYTRGSPPLAQNPAWSNAYSVFTGGQTQVFITATTPQIGDYILINGTLFYIASVPSGGVYHIQSLAFADADYTATTNGAYTCTDFYNEWQTT